MIIPAQTVRSIVIVLFPVLLMLAYACHAGKKSVASSVLSPVQTVMLHSDTSQARIKLFVFELLKDSTTATGERCTLVSTQLATGRLKTPLGTPGFVQPGDLICHFYNHRGQLLQTWIQEDPLTTPVEAFEENGHMSRHILSKTRAELMLRVQYSTDLHQLLIGKVMPDKSVVTLLDLTL